MISLQGIDVVHSTIQWSDINGPGTHERMVISLDISVKNTSRVLPNFALQTYSAILNLILPGCPKTLIHQDPHSC